ncbi:MAG: hypothetical protein MJ252_23600, partial [archaeon]|nr:hypothetical protein [archaeon]
MLAKLKNYQKPEQEDDKDMEYLNQTNLAEVVSRGIAELIEVYPENPITFLSNWLQVEAASYEAKKRLAERREKKEIIRKKKEEKVKEKEEIETKKLEEENVKQAERKELEDLITNCTDFEDGLNGICEKFRKIINATGVYVSKYDIKRKYPIEPDADENGHLDPEGTKVLQYVNWCGDHDFLHRQILDLESGVTYRLILPKEGDEEGEEDNKPEENKDEGEGEEGEGDKPKEPTEEILKHIYVEDVVNDPNIKFFREPRLGCYLAVDIRYQSSMQYSSLLSAIKNFQEYKEKAAEQEKRRLEKEEEAKQKAEEMAANGEDEANEENEGEEKENAEAEGEEKEEKEEEEQPVQLEPFEKEEKIYIIGIDTLGQDRSFTEEEKKYILDVAKLIRNSMANLEIKLLEKDRDLRMEYIKEETPIKDEYNEDKIDAEKENYLREYQVGDEFVSKNITNEDEKDVDFQMAKAKAIVNCIYNTPMLDLIQRFEQFEFVQFEKIFQNLFYFAKIKGEDINETDTHKLSWKKARKIWSGILDTIKEYNPIGPKPEIIENNFKGNVILENLEPYVAEQPEAEAKPEGEEEKEDTNSLDYYSYSLKLLIQYVVEILKVRKEDIIRRHTVKKQLERDRNEILRKNKKINKSREREKRKAEKDFYKQQEEEEKEEEEKEEEDKEEEDKEEEEKDADEKKDEDKDEDEEEEKEEDEQKKTETQGKGTEENKEKEETKENAEEGQENAEGEEGENTGKKKKSNKPKFNEEEWIETFNSIHPLQEVPEEVVFDIDNDFDVQFEDVEEENKEEEDDEKEEEEE